MSQRRISLRSGNCSKTSRKSTDSPEVAQLRSALCCACDQNDMLRRKIQELEALYVEAALRIEAQQDTITHYIRQAMHGNIRPIKHYRSKSV